VHYEQLCRKTPQGEPWSIHVLRVARKNNLRIHAVAGHNEAGQMARELPTAMAERDLARGHRVVAVINGDFDTVKPESNFGVSVGLSVVEGRLWTGDQSSRPVLAFTQDNQPLIGVPKLSIELLADERGTKIATFNKPMIAGTTAVFTTQYRPELQFAAPSSALLAEHSTFDHPLPLYKKLKARVTDQPADITQLKLPAKTIALVPSPFASDQKKLKLRLKATVNEYRIRDAVGGFPIIVRDNHPSTEGAAVAGNLAMRHPRTAVCYDRDSIFFTVVDGRQSTLSVGMTLTELAQFMIELGCDVAMNTDGGGSSVMALTDGSHLRIVNSPSDGHARGRGNAWVIETQ
jgi:exopolysaccharide biosynthesis protein